MKHKKAQIANYMAVIIFLFIFIASIVIGATIFFTFKEQSKEIPVLNNNTNIDKAMKGFELSYLSYDYINVIIMVLLIIGVGVTSYKLATPPIFFIISIVMAVFLGLISYFFNYLAQQYFSADAFAGVLMYYPLSMQIVQNFHWIAIVLFMVGSITLYAKKDQGQYL